MPKGSIVWVRQKVNKKRKHSGVTICVDFDGTVVTHAYPKIGHDIGAFPILKKLQSFGHRIILWTMRSGEELLNAAEYMEENGIKLYGVNVNPTQKEWTLSPKAYGQLYIDDAALGCPLIGKPGLDRAFVDWKAIDMLLEAEGYYK